MKMKILFIKIILLNLFLFSKGIIWSLESCKTNIPKPPNIIEMHNEIRTKFISLFREQISNEGIIFLEGGQISTRYETDVELNFRQESNFLYLTGIDEPSFSLIINIQTNEYLLFVPERDEHYALWNGEIETPEEIMKKYGVNAVYYDHQLETVMKKLTKNMTLPVFILEGTSFKGKEKFIINDKSLIKILILSRTTKTLKELDMLRVAAKVSSDAHIMLMKDCKPFLYEYNLESYFVYYSSNCGLENQAYHPIVGSGNHSSILHYNKNKDIMLSSQLVLVDAGAEYYGYASDITRTYPVNGKFNEKQKQIYKMVLNIINIIEEKIKPGIQWNSLQQEATRLVCEHLLQAGFLQGNIDELISNKVCSLFFPHGLGHHIGLDVHDADIIPKIIEKNMVLAIEPGIYFNKAFIEKGMKNEKQKPYLVFHKIEEFLNDNFGGIRIEDDVIVTDYGIENITKVPKTIEEIETIMSNSSLFF